MTKLAETSETSIAITFLVMNLMTLLRRVMRGFLWLFWHQKLVTEIIEMNKLYLRGKSIIKAYNTAKLNLSRTIVVLT